MTFDAQIIHWPDVPAFTAYLATIPRPDWCDGATAHNTYRPNESQWRGLASMRGMCGLYEARGWSAGPHLFLAAECERPIDSGIWQMTPLDHTGIHAGACNKTRLGIESVADWQARPPTPMQYRMLLDVMEAICRAWQFAASAINVHKECMPERTCPGRYLPPAQLRADLEARLVPRPVVYRVAGLPVYERQDLTGPIAGYLDSGAHVAIDMLYDDGAAHLDSGLGFVDRRGLEHP